MAAERGPFDRAPIVILSSIEWSAAWQRHQVFASQWAAAGHDVFFVENTGFRDLSPRDLPRIARRLTSRIVGRLARRSDLPARVAVVSPIVLPPSRPLFRKLNELLFIPMLAEQLRAAGVPDGAVVVAYLPTATTLKLLDALRPGLVVYDCVDNFYGLPSAAPDLAALEGELLSRSALVLTTSSTLRAEKAALHGNVVELHHGVSADFFLPPPPPRPARRLCYFGTLWRAIDYAPIRALAEAGYEVDLIGPRKEAPPPLPPGVRLLDPVPHGELPGILGGYDALLLPYVDDEYNRGVVPAKLFECLATGRPVIASPLPALEPYAALVTRARSPQDWVAAAEALGRDGPAGREARVAAARDRTTDRTFAQMRLLVRRAWQSASGAPGPAPEGRHLRALLGAVSWIGLLYGLAKVSTLVTQVVAGRALGPVEYGRANLALAAAAYLQLAPMLGFPTAISRFVSRADSDEERRRVASTALACFAGWALLCAAVLAAVRPRLPGLLNVPPHVLDLALLLAFATAVYTVLSSQLLGLRRFEQRGIAEVVYGAGAPALLLLLLWWRGTRDSSMVLALCGSLVFATAYAAAAVGRVRLSIDRALAGPFLRYAAVAAFNFLAAACVLAPAKLILNHADSALSVGIFSAYFTVTVQIALAAGTMLTAAIVPVTSVPEAQEETWRTLRRFWAPATLFAWAGFFAAAALALRLFGSRYPVSTLWLALFSAAAALVLLHGVVSALLSARDFSGLRTAAAGSLVAGVGNAALAWKLIPAHGITGAALALIGGFAMGLAVYGVRARSAA